MSSYFSEEESIAIEMVINRELNELLNDFKITRTKSVIHAQSTHEFLNAYTKDMLLKLAEGFGLDIKKSWKKGKVLEHLEEYMTDFFYERLFALDKQDYILLKEFALNDQIPFKNDKKQIDWLLKTLRPAVKLGLVYPCLIDDDLYPKVPIEVIEGIKTFENKKVNLNRKKQITELKSYVTALVHLYGVVDLPKIMFIWNHTYPKHELTDQFLEHSLPLIPLIAIAKSYYFIRGLFIADNSFENELYAVEVYYEAWEKFEDDFYIPSKSDLTYFANNEYDKRTLSYKRMERFIKNISSDYESVMSILTFYIVRGMPLSEAMEEINEEDLLQFTSDKQIERFGDLYMQLNNHSRMWGLFGYTPKEISEKGRVTRSSKEPFIPFNNK